MAQVLSHLGSGAEIFSALLDAGLNGEDPPGVEMFRPIWAEWDARAPQERADDSVAANEALIGRFEQLGDEEARSFRLALFGMDLDLAGLCRMRLSEHALHSWDIAVAVDPDAVVAPASVALLVDGLPAFVARAGKPTDPPLEVTIVAHDPERRFRLTTDPVALVRSDGAVAAEASVELPAEALVRLVAGRLDTARTPPSVRAEGVQLDELRRAFPGF